MNDLVLLPRTQVVLESGATVYVDATPPVGEAWEITAAYAFHDEGANLNTHFAIYLDAVNGWRDLCNVTSLASGTYLQLYTAVPCKGPIVLHYGQSLRCNAAAKTGGKTVAMVLLLKVLKGETVFVG